MCIYQSIVASLWVKNSPHVLSTKCLYYYSLLNEMILSTSLTSSYGLPAFQQPMGRDLNPVYTCSSCEHRRQHLTGVGWEIGGDELSLKAFPSSPKREKWKSSEVRQKPSSGRYRSQWGKLCRVVLLTVEGCGQTSPSWGTWWVILERAASYYPI